MSREETGGESYPQLATNVPSRHAERARYDRQTVHQILDEAMLAHVGFVVEDRPQVLPMLFVRVGEKLYLHGSTGAHMNRMTKRRRSLRLAVEVTLVDGLVLARSTFDHSANYRSVVVSGEASIVEGEKEKAAVLEALVEKLVSGRTADARPPTSEELRQTAVLEIDLEEVSAKVRTGDPVDEPEDLSRECWAGVLPILRRFAEPLPAANLSGGTPLPGYLRELSAPGLDN